MVACSLRTLMLPEWMWERMRYKCVEKPWMSRREQWIKNCTAGNRKSIWDVAGIVLCSDGPSHKSQETDTDLPTAL